MQYIVRVIDGNKSMLLKTSPNLYAPTVYRKNQMSTTIWDAWLAYMLRHVNSQVELLKGFESLVFAPEPK